MANLRPMADAFIVDALRTPIGRHGGGLSGVRPDDLAAHVMRAAVERNEIDPAGIDDVFFGAANQSGEDNRNVARMGALLAGLPVETPGTTVNRLCASGLEAVNQASRAAKVGEGDLFLAGGVESMTRAPLVQLKSAKGFARGVPEMADTTIGWRFINPNMEYSTEGMGATAENVAERYEVTRADQDAFALESHRRAGAAQDEGTFEREIVPLEAPSANGKRGEKVLVEADEGVRRDTTLERLAGLKAIFREGGSVTAGNASQINDGAACVVVASERGLEKLGNPKPLARVVTAAAAGVDPAYMGVGPIPAGRLALERAGLSIDDIDLVEINEAFAAQVVPCMRELGISHEKLNVNGGAIAIGHPLGCSGARLVGTLAHELRARGGRYGMAALCIGVGQGLATIIENVDA